MNELVLRHLEVPVRRSPVYTRRRNHHTETVFPDGDAFHHPAPPANSLLSLRGNRRTFPEFQKTPPTGVVGVQLCGGVKDVFLKRAVTTIVRTAVA